MNSIFGKIKKAAAMPKNELAAKLAEKAREKLKHAKQRYIPATITDRQFCKYFNCSDSPRLITLFRDRHKSDFFFHPGQKEEYISLIREHYPGEIENTIRRADLACQHVFDLLGSGPVHLGPKIDWHRDFKSGFRWDPNGYYVNKHEKYVDFYNNADPKVPWELARFQHAVDLGKAYWYTGDEKYALEFVSQVQSFIDNNTVNLGINWACPMDVAIRAVNWIWGYHFFLDSPSLKKDFLLKFYKSLFLHGRFIINNLEWSEIRGNHYLSDIVGLVYLGLFFPPSRESAFWFAKGYNSLQEEMYFQVNPDGTNIENSMSYHRLVLELFLSSALLCEITGNRLPGEYYDRLEKMFEFTCAYTKPDGKAPQMGDSDDGRLHKLGAFEFLDHRYLLSAGAVIFKRPDFKKASGGFHEEALWLLGPKGLADYSVIPDRKTIPANESFFFPDGGFCIMRSGDRFLMIDRGDVGLKGWGCHGHNDIFSFELYAGDRTLIVDPGSYIYTADFASRNLFRSTAFHNTVRVDGQEINPFDEKLPFTLFDTAKPRVIKWASNEKHDLFEGEHYGYRRLVRPVIHRRWIVFVKSRGFWIMRDILLGEGEHNVELNFHFSPGIVEALDRQAVRTCYPGGTNLLLFPVYPAGTALDLIDTWVSYSYGTRKAAQKAVYTWSGPAGVEFLTVLVPFEGGCPDLEAVYETAVTELKLVNDWGENE